MPRDSFLFALTLILAIVLLSAKETLIGDARWWNLVLAGLLLVLLVQYLRAQRR
jgi:hypothetical protein